MVKPATTRVSRTSADALAAKLKVITAAAPGLRQAGVTSLVVDGDHIKLADLPPAPDKGDGDESVDPYTLDGFRGDRAPGEGDGTKGGRR